METKHGPHTAHSAQQTHTARIIENPEREAHTASRQNTQHAGITLDTQQAHTREIENRKQQTGRGFHRRDKTDLPGALCNQPRGTSKGVKRRRDCVVYAFGERVSVGNECRAGATHSTRRTPHAPNTQSVRHTQQAHRTHSIQGKHTGHTTTGTQNTENSTQHTQRWYIYIYIYWWFATAPNQSRES